MRYFATTDPYTYHGKTFQKVNGLGMSYTIIAHYYRAFRWRFDKLEMSNQSDQSEES